MLFNTWEFAIFAVIIVAAYRVLPSHLRAFLLILSGVVFYATAGLGYLFVILGLAALTYTCARILQTSDSPGRRRAIMAWAVLVLTVVLCYFKYSHWISKALAQAVPWFSFHTFGAVIIPLAISFFTFEFVHFVADVHAGRIERFTLKDFAAFALFFPTMVAGPIKRFGLFSPQLGDLRMAQGAQLQTAIYRIACGFFKKLAIADPITIFTVPLSHPSPGTPASVYAVATVAGTIKIFYDFCGYTDIAIGFALLFGVSVPENFARPFYAPNILEFWRRWHISLSSWVRDYIFNPLVKKWRNDEPGSRQRALVTIACFVISMFVIGMWHGAGLQFAAWGLWNGLSLTVYYLWRRTIATRIPAVRDGSATLTVLSIGLTYASFAFGAILFAAPSLSDALMVYRSFL